MIPVSGFRSTSVRSKTCRRSSGSWSSRAIGLDSSPPGGVTLGGSRPARPPCRPVRRLRAPPLAGAPPDLPEGIVRARRGGPRDDPPRLPPSPPPRASMPLARRPSRGSEPAVGRAGGLRRPYRPRTLLTPRHRLPLLSTSVEGRRSAPARPHSNPCRRPLFVGPDTLPQRRAARDAYVVPTSTRVLVCHSTRRAR